MHALGPSGALRVKTKDGGKVTLLHLAGDDGAVVLVLPANGFHVKCYTKLARGIAGSEQRYQCWGVEFRGQGSVTAPAGNLLNIYMLDLLSIVETLSLKGCLVFGHSGGAQIAIMAEAHKPGTLASIYLFEPVLWPVRPTTQDLESQQLILGYQALASLAKLRRSQFDSKEDAMKTLRSKPPFAALHFDCFRDYIDNGLVEQSDGTCQLLISTALEERCYMEAFHAANGSGSECPPHVWCPVTIAVGDGRHGMVRFLAAEGTKQASHFPKGRCERFQELTHMGPLEDPVKLATRVIKSFIASRDDVAWAALPASEFIPIQEESKL